MQWGDGERPYSAGERPRPSYVQLVAELRSKMDPLRDQCCFRCVRHTSFAPKMVTDADGKEHAVPNAREMYIYCFMVRETIMIEGDSDMPVRHAKRPARAIHRGMRGWIDVLIPGGNGAKTRVWVYMPHKNEHPIRDRVPDKAGDELLMEVSDLLVANEYQLMAELLAQEEDDAWCKTDNDDDMPSASASALLPESSS